MRVEIARRRIPWIVASFLIASILAWTLASASEAAPSQPDTQDSCVDCHLTLESRYAAPAREWLTSIHADYEVLCTDCHGGDALASTQERAMSEESGFIGRPPKAQIPQLCGECHADPERMAPYGVPTNQLSEYQESKHGQLLVEGDPDVATCYDCHGGHATLDTRSPNSAVYPTNLPETCAKCHSNTQLMEPYGVDTHQYELFRLSVHGTALLDEHDLRAPTCASCHGNHGAALPGLGELVDVCGVQCHPLTEDVYLSGPHGSGAADNPDAPNCVTCHSRYDIQEADEGMLVGTEAGHCGSCHSPESPEGEIAALLYNEISSTSGAVAEVESLAETPEEKQLVLEAQTRLMEARVLQHALQPDVVQEKTEEARALSARVQENAYTGETAAVTEWNLVMLIGLIMGAIVVCLVMGGIAWRIIKR
jgi:hypothetical protein